MMKTADPGVAMSMGWVRSHGNRVSVVVGVALFTSICSAQISPINPPSGWKVPNGAGACTVGKSCAELVPTMMQSALGASPLEENLRYLTTTLRGRVTGSPKAARAVGWTVEAFHRAGVDEVHTEKFMVRNGWSEGHARAMAGPVVESENVVAEIRGREPDKFVVLGAHLDDSSDTALMIDAARVIHTSGSVPRRSIRFVLFAGEKQEMAGSWAYARAHRDELDRTSAVILFDGGIGTVSGYSLGGRKDALAPVREALAPLAPLGVKDFTLDASIDADRLDFILEGILTLEPNQKPADEATNHQAASDTASKTDIPALKRQAGIAAITTYALADTSEPITRRQSRAEIEQLLKDTGLSGRMKREGLWPAWESGERGRKR
ncbi:MAG TPA: M28 family peptidase [Candidatus Acidoferrales bacterium]|nr:M28 family peptidase [Candidatus Acidoferrales bacterium]